MNKIFYFLFLLFVALGTSACNSPYTADDLINCNEGSYSISSEVKANADMMGMKASHAQIWKDGNTCNLMLILKEPMMFMGTEVSAFPVYECDLWAVPILQEQGWDSKDIADKVCE